MFRGTPSPAPAAAATLAMVCGTFQGLTSLVCHWMGPLPGSLAGLQTLENLEAIGVEGPLPEALGRLSHLTRLELGGREGLPAAFYPDRTITAHPQPAWVRSAPSAL